MHVSSALISYFITIIICLFLPVFTGVLYKKNGHKIALPHFLMGLGVFVISSVGFFILFKYHLSIKDGVSDYYNTAAYRIAIVSLICALLLVLIWIVCMKAYVKRQATNECTSFFAGFGILGVFLLGIYALFMFLQLIVMLCTHSLESFDTIKQAFCFSQDTYVFVFAPIWGHVSFAIALLSFLIVSICFAMVLNRIARANLPFWVNLTVFVTLILAITAIFVIAAFMKMIGISHYVMAIFDVVLVGVSLGVVRLSYVTEQKRPENYSKQFE